MDSVHKKPYEVVIIGHYLGCEERESVSMSSLLTHPGSCDSALPSKKLCLSEGLTTNNEDKSIHSDCCAEGNREPASINVTPLENIPETERFLSDGECITTATCSMDVSGRDHIYSVSSGEESGRLQECIHHNIPPKLSKPFVFMCVASQTHSQKPYLGGNVYIICNDLGKLCVHFYTNGCEFAKV